MDGYKLKAKEAVGSTENYPAKNVIDKVRQTYFDNFPRQLSEGEFHWLQIKLKQASAIWKIAIRSVESCCSDTIEIWVGNHKIQNEENGTESKISMNWRSENSDGNTTNPNNITKLLPGNKLCGKFKGSGTTNDIYLIDCLTQNQQDIDGEFITIASKELLMFSEIDIYGSSKNYYSTKTLA